VGTAEQIEELVDRLIGTMQLDEAADRLAAINIGDVDVRPQRRGNLESGVLEPFDLRCVLGFRNEYGEVVESFLARAYMSR